MKRNAVKLSKADKTVKAIIRATFPDWKGRKVRAIVATEYKMADHWGGGTRDFVKAYGLESGAASEPRVEAQNPMNAKAHATVAIPENVVLVEHSIFCGEDVGVTIYVNPANAAKLLPAAA